MTMTTNSERHPRQHHLPCVSDVVKIVVAVGYAAVGSAGAGMAFYGLIFLISAISHLHFLGYIPFINLMTTASVGALMGVAYEVLRIYRGQR